MMSGSKSSAINHFRLVMIKPEMNFTVDGGKQEDLELIRNQVVKLAQEEAHGIASGAKDAADHARKARLEYQRKGIEAAKPRAKAWVENVFVALQKQSILVEDKSKSVSSGYQSDELILILTTECAFNGRHYTDSHSTDFDYDSFDANYPVHEEIVSYIAQEAHNHLRMFSHQRIVFAMSCSTYGDALVKQPDNQYKLKTANGITVITPSSTATNPKFIPKLKADSLDGWPAVFAEPQSTARGAARESEIKFDLSCIGAPDAALAFGSCIDMKDDAEHPGVNLVVYLAGGGPLAAMTDKKHSFVINDIDRWTNADDEEYRICHPRGLCTFSDVKLADAVDVYEYMAHKQVTTQVPTGPKCYWHQDPDENPLIGHGKIWFSNLIPFPLKV